MSSEVISSGGDGKKLKDKFNICMCCDFFYPRLGGVEMHIFQLSLGKLMRNLLSFSLRFFP